MKSYIDNIGNHKKISGDDQCDFAEKRGYTNEIRVFSSLLGRNIVQMVSQVIPRGLIPSMLSSVYFFVIFLLILLAA